MCKTSLLRRLALWLTLEIGAFMGLPIRPDEIERLMRTACQAKIIRSLPDDETKRQNHQQ
jgi:hypothetical protein